MTTTSIIPLFSAFVSLIAMFLVIFIFNKVYQENYKKPWLFIGLSILFLSFAKIGTFLSGFFGINIINLRITTFIIDILNFISISILTYAILLEFMILKYYKGKFIKFRFIPVQEGSLDANLEISVSKGNSYLVYKKDINFFDSQFSLATKSGFEGFLITEENPKEFRTKNKLIKTPIAWISQIQSGISSEYLKNTLDSNSEMVEPINLNNIINYFDNFLEQSTNPFIMIDLNLILKLNNFQIVYEFIEYLNIRIRKNNGILLCRLNKDIIDEVDLNKLKTILINLE